MRNYPAAEQAQQLPWTSHLRENRNHLCCQPSFTGQKWENRLRDLVKIFRISRAAVLEEVSKIQWKNCLQPKSASLCPWSGQIWVCASGSRLEWHLHVEGFQFWPPSAIEFENVFHLHWFPATFTKPLAEGSKLKSWDCKTTQGPPSSGVLDSGINKFWPKTRNLEGFW